MKFEEVIDAIRNEKKVRRSSWKNPNYYFGQMLCYECDSDCSKEDLLAEDWEVIE